MAILGRKTILLFKVSAIVIASMIYFYERVQRTIIVKSD